MLALDSRVEPASMPKRSIETFGGLEGSEDRRSCVSKLRLVAGDLDILYCVSAIID